MTMIKHLFRLRAFSCLAALLFVSLSITAADENIFSDEKGFSQWTVVGPAGGDVRAMAVDPRDPNLLYISTLDGQIHTSQDGGKTWRLLVNLEEPQMIIDDLIVDAVDSNLIYASGHRYTRPGGFYKSADGGKTWKASPQMKGEAIHALVQSEVDTKRLIAGTISGVWISDDSGDSWQHLQTNKMPIVNSLAVDPNDLKVMYAGTKWRSYKTTDEGKTWNLIKNGMIDDSDVMSMSINHSNPNHVFASACSGMYQSLDGGQKWTKFAGIPSDSRRTHKLKQHPTKPDVLYAGTTQGFWMSVNGGRTWSMTTQRNMEVNSISIHSSYPDRVIIGTNNFGVMISNDGGRTFTPTNQDFTSRFAYKIAVDKEDPLRMFTTTHNTATSGGYFFLSKDGGTTWTQGRGMNENSVSPYALLQNKATPNKLYLGTNKGFYRSLDRGESWTAIKAPPVPRVTGRTAAQRRAATAAAAKAKLENAIYSEWIKVIAYTDEEKGQIMAGTVNGLYKTNDVEKGWQKVSLGEGINENIFAIETSPLMPGTIWVGTMTSGVMVSRDEGETWEQVNATPPGIPIMSIKIDPKRPNYIYVGTTQSLYLSRDGGREWIRRGGRLPLGSYSSILINPNNTDEMFTSSSLESDGGVYFSKDAGMTWDRVDSGMNVPSRRIWAMIFDPRDPNKIFAASHSSGIYRIERLPEIAAEENNSTEVGKVVN